ncbi:unnamed protein product [Merluccius merluccius]
MARANISVPEDRFRCPVCLEVLRDPVSIPCGHTYCMGCIGRYWDQDPDPGDPAGRVRCPQCREPFSPRPVLRRNAVLADLLGGLTLTPDPGDPGDPGGPGGTGTGADVPCDFCPADGPVQRAVRSCLVCLASFCETHVQPHRQVRTLRRHRLVPALQRPADRLCAQHRLGLEPAGTREDGEADRTRDWTGDCLLCEADQEEGRGADGLRARRQLQLQESRRLVQERTRTAERDLEDFQQSLDSFKVSTSAVLEESEALFADVAVRLEKIKAEVRARLQAKERAVVGRAEREVEVLQREVEELRRREEEISRLLQTDDNTHFLQAAPPLCQAPPPSGRRCRAAAPPADTFSAARKALCHFRSRMEEVSSEEVDKISLAVNENCVSGGECLKVTPVAFPLSSVSLQPSDQRMRAAFLRFSCDLSLDPDTAHPTLVLLPGPSAGVHCGEEPQAYGAHPQRFDSVAQVLCREGQFSGASYWEVEWRGGGWVDVGVTYRGIGRKGGGKPCLLGRNEHSWRLRCTHTGYSAWHDNRKTTVASAPCPRVAVFLERHRGTLSFYSVADALTLLHTFQGPFSQPLFPAFRLDLDATLVIHPPPPCGAAPP